MVRLSCQGTMSQETIMQIQQQFAEDTGWSLELQVPSSEGGSAEDGASARCSQAEAMAQVGMVLTGASDLYQIGADTKRGVLCLHFYFPDVARVRYGEQFTTLAEQTGWQVEVHARVHQKALIEQARLLLPDGINTVGKASVYQDQQRLSLVCSEPLGEEDQQEMQRRFRELTGWDLQIALDGPRSAPAVPGRMSEQEALALIHASLAPDRVSMDAVRGVLMLSLNGAEQSAVSNAVLDDLQRQTGWQIQIASAR